MNKRALRSLFAISILTSGTISSVASNSALAAQATAVDEGSTATAILRVGDAYPGRPGDLVAAEFSDVDPFVAGMPDANGDISFAAQRSSDFDLDVLRYHTSDGSINPYLQSGITTSEGFALDRIFAVQVNANASGQVLTDGVIRDIPSGNTSFALLPALTPNHASVAAAVNIPVPNQPQGFFLFNSITTSPLGGVTYNLNDSGLVAYEAPFDVGSTHRQGVYNWTASGGLKRVIDSSQAVPGHANASWVPFVNGDPEQTPFDPYHLQLTDTGETIFLAKFKIGSTVERALYRGSVTGGLSAIVDPARGDQVPGRPAGTTFFSIADSPLADKAGDVAFQGIATSSFERGVYLQRGAGQPLLKIHDNHDTVAGLPADANQLTFTLLAMSDQAHVAFNTTYNDSTGQHGALMLGDPAGNTRLLARLDQLTDLPPDATLPQFHGTTAVNDEDDVLATVSYDSQSGSRASVYAYLNDEQRLVRVLAPGDILDGMMVDDFELFVPPSSGGFGNTFTDDRRFVASVHLVPLPGAPADETDTWGLYNFQVVPEPASGTLSIVAIGLFLTRRRGPLV